MNDHLSELTLPPYQGQLPATHARPQPRLLHSDPAAPRCSRSVRSWLPAKIPRDRQCNLLCLLSISTSHALNDI